MFEVYYRTNKSSKSFVAREETLEEAENLKKYIKSFGGMRKSGLEFVGLAEDGVPIEEPEQEKPAPKKEVWGKPPLKSSQTTKRKKRSPTLQKNEQDYKIEWGRMKQYETCI